MNDWTNDPQDETHAWQHDPAQTESWQREAWEAVVMAVTRRATTTYPTETTRILQGMTIVIDGGVQIDGSDAWVQSQTHANQQYHVNGGCSCPDAQYRAPEGRCQHRWAKAIALKSTIPGMVPMHKRVPAPVPAPVLTIIPTPSPSPVSPRYYATWYPDATRKQGEPGIAQCVGAQWEFTPDDGTTPLLVSLAYLTLGGDIALCEAQRAVDGASLGTKFGQPQLPQY